MLKKVAYIIITCLIGSYTCFSQADFSERVNLALRRTGHKLLLQAGDTATTIAPIQPLNANTFLLTLTKGFNYDALPAILDESFKIYEITNLYHVSIIDSKTGSLVLGYNYIDFAKDKAVPCSEREQDYSQVQVKVSFTEAIATSSTPISSAWVWGSVAAVAIVGVGLWKSQRKQIDSQTNIAVSVNAITFGKTILDCDNLNLQVADTTHTLTYREAKLLQIFAKHPNQVLARDFLLNAVWGEEGVTVGRSLDVFVSRLRKLLQPDLTLKIVAVHGIGYRLDIG